MPVSHSVLRSRLLSNLVTETSRSPRRRRHLRGVHWFIAVMSSEAPSLAASSLSVGGSALHKKVLLRLATMGPAAQAIVTVIYCDARQSPPERLASSLAPTVG